MEPSEQAVPDSGSQEVNPVYLQQLRELDIPEEAAKQVPYVPPPSPAHVLFDVP